MINLKLRHAKRSIIKSKYNVFVFFFTLSLVALVALFQNCAKRTNLAEYASEGDSNKQTVHEDISVQLEEILNDPAAVASLISDSTNNAFACLRSESVQCLNGLRSSILINRVFTAQNNIFLDDLKNTHRGLTDLGQQCSTYNFLNNIDGVTDENCDLRVEIFWEPVCQNGSLSCSDSQLVHKFKVIYLTSKLAAPQNIVATKSIEAPATLVTYSTFSDARGGGITLYEFNSVTGVKSPLLYYRSCNGGMTLATNATCSCPAGQIEDLDTANLCAAATQSCLNTVPNSAVCNKQYVPATNSYVLNASDSNNFRCASGYTAYNGTCQANTTACSVTNGTCINNFNASTGAYNQVITCNSGYGKPAANKQLCLPKTWTSAARDYTYVYCYGDTANHAYTPYYKYSSYVQIGKSAVSITNYGSYVYGKEGSTANGGFKINCTLSE